MRRPPWTRPRTRVSQEAIDAGVYVFAGRLEDHKRSVILATDGTVIDGQHPDSIGGITILDVPAREQALEWATKVAVACPCAVEVWEIGACQPQARGDAPRGR